jgi:hypothetical protein
MFLKRLQAPERETIEGDNQQLGSWLCSRRREGGTSLLDSGVVRGVGIEKENMRINRNIEGK